MKSPSQVIGSLLGATLLATSSFADEMPETFLGVGVDAIPAALHNALDLDPGTGLVINFVAQDSPAGRAGLKKEDILLKLEDQILIHPGQLSTLVRNRISGETVTMEIVRGGEKQTLDVVLAERLVDRPETNDGAGPGPGPGLEGGPKVEEDAPNQGGGVGNAGAGNPFFMQFPGGGGFGFNFGAGGPQMEQLQEEMERAQKEMEEAMKNMQFQFDFRGLDNGNFDPQGMIEELRRAMEQGMGEAGRGPGAGARFNAPNFPQQMNSSASTVMINDGQHVLKLKSEDGQTFLNAKTAGGEEIYDGPYNTEADKEQVPEEIREKLKRVNIQTGGIRFGGARNGLLQRKARKPETPEVNPEKKPNDA